MALVQRGSAEDHVERLAIDHDSVVTGDVGSRRHWVVLVSDIAFEFA